MGLGQGFDVKELDKDHEFLFFGSCLFYLVSMFLVCCLEFGVFIGWFLVWGDGWFGLWVWLFEVV